MHMHLHYEAHWVTITLFSSTTKLQRSLVFWMRRKKWKRLETHRRKTKKCICKCEYVWKHATWLVIYLLERDAELLGNYLQCMLGKDNDVFFFHQSISNRRTCWAFEARNAGQLGSITGLGFHWFLPSV